uniref:TYRO protein tyrosine kinase-binding protein n=1 Tax=Xiphophorus couchianus TaxID=32473 RepID=A0A3B5L0J7_9TELE
MPDALCVVGSMFGESHSQCGTCYLINMGSVIGIIASDILLTMFLIISVFFFASHHRRRKERERNLSLSASKKMTPEDTESPYQELHGVQSDIYNELRHFRK